MSTPGLNEWLQACGLPQAWGLQPQWQVLDTRFGQGQTFLAAWAAWRADQDRPGRLHYLALDDHQFSASELMGLAGADPHLLPLARQLATQARGLLAGVHRLVFEEGALHLTLCIGSPLAQLREQELAVDSVFAHPLEREPAARELQALARCCRRGTRLACATKLPPEAMRQAGFTELSGSSEPSLVQAVFDPPWQPRRKRSAVHDLAQAALAGHALVIGAGLAGAASASSLARRGWQVTVLERTAPAAGASGLPVGLMAPHVSPDDSQLSRLSRAGLRATWLEARRLLEEGRDWSACGVLQRRLDEAGSALPANWPAAGLHWSLDAAAVAGIAPELRTHALWHPCAGWIKPARLVRAWLEQPGITLRTGQGVTSLRRLAQDAWQAQDASGRALAEAKLVVVATAHESRDLLAPLLEGHGLGLQPVRGQVSWGLHARGEALPAWPVNGHGSLVPSYPEGDKQAWLLGATFERDDVNSDIRSEGNDATFSKLSRLLPGTAESLRARFAGGQVQGWAGVRCATRDHLPAVGPLWPERLPGLWLCTGFGSRGLSYSALCGELVAAWLHAEPLPLEPRLAQALQASRLLRPR